MVSIEVEVLRNDLGVRHPDCELAFEERDQLEDAGRIDQARVEQRLAVGRDRRGPRGTGNCPR